VNQCRRIVNSLRKTECHNTVDDFPLCFDCVKILGQIVKDLKEYSDELETQITRQVKGAPSVGAGSSDESRLAFDYEASRARDHLETVLARIFAENTEANAHAYLQGRTIEDRIRILLAWFRMYYVYLGRSPQGPQILADLDHALHRAMRVCDRKQDKIHIGVCECGQDISAYPKQSSIITCPKCGSEFDPAKTRRRMRIEGGSQHVTIKQAQKLGEIWGRKVNTNTVKSWHRRGKIKCTDPNCGKGHEHTYLMSDILTLHKEN